jgi:dolichol-phosphate mannosyltransferase
MPNEGDVRMGRELWTHIRRLVGVMIRLLRQNRRLLFIALPIAFASDIVLFQILFSQGVEPRVAHLFSSLTQVAVFAALAGRVVTTGRKRGVSVGEAAILFVTVALAAMFLRTGVFTFRMEFSHWSARVAIFAAATATLLSMTLALLVALSPAVSDTRLKERRERFAVIGLILYLFILRLLYLPLFNLIPEEAYYWNYSQHLAWGYLDHPPMVAWLNVIGTFIFGHTELGVRFGAMLSWVLASFFIFKLTREMFTRSAALMILLVMSSLPFFFGTAILLTPDAPLTACWAGALLYLYRALVKGNRNAWYVVGLFVGLGMLSKYTIALLGPAGLIYMLIDPRAKQWLKKPQPYLSVLISLVLFSPVIYWNSQHEWVSFIFQSSRRIEAAIHVSPHLLLASALFLLTPVGFWAALMAFRPRTDLSHAEHRLSRWGFSPQFMFGLVFTLFPVSIFLAFSITHEPKLNWTGPSWLAILPAVSFMMTMAFHRTSDRLVRFTRIIWIPTLLIMTVLYGASLNYLRPGFPRLGYPESMKTVAGFDDLGRQVGRYVGRLASSSGREPLVVGMDKYNISSELAFYNRASGPANTTGIHLFGGNALSYRYWMSPRQAAGRNIVLVGRDSVQVSVPWMESHFDSVGVITWVPVTLNRMAIGRYAVRTGWSYRP